MLNFFSFSDENSPNPPLVIPFLLLKAAILYAIVAFFCISLALTFLQKKLSISDFPLFLQLFLYQSPYSIGACLVPFLYLLKSLPSISWRNLLNMPDIVPLSKKTFYDLFFKYLSLIFFGSILLNLASITVLKKLGFEDLPGHFLQTFLNDADKSYLVQIFLSAVILAPITEEIIFRRFLFGFFKHINPGSASILSAFFFALSHNVFWAFVTYFFMGLILQQAAKQGSLWLSIALHSAFNLIILIIMGLV